MKKFKYSSVVSRLLTSTWTPSISMIALLAVEQWLWTCTPVTRSLSYHPMLIRTLQAATNTLTHSQAFSLYPYRLEQPGVTTSYCMPDLPNVFRTENITMQLGLPILLGNKCFYCYGILLKRYHLIEGSYASRCYPILRDVLRAYTNCYSVKRAVNISWWRQTSLKPTASLKGVNFPWNRISL